MYIYTNSHVTSTDTRQLLVSSQIYCPRVFVVVLHTCNVNIVLVVMYCICAYVYRLSLPLVLIKASYGYF